jgi:hypothetical protein
MFSESSRTVARVRGSLFILTGLALPFYVFPIARALGKPLDLATICAALFVLTSLPLLASGTRRGPAIFAAGCVFLPLLALLPPRPGFFEVHGFARSYAHWLLLIAFFLGALRLELSVGGRNRILLANVISATVVALFALYQVVGFPLGWPVTDTLVSFQREPLRLGFVGGYVRPTSVFGEPAWMGGYLAWSLVLFASLLPKAGLASRVALLAGSTFVLAAVLASVSWGAYACLLVVGVVTAAAVVKRRLVHPRIIFAAVGLLALLIIAGSFSGPGRRILGAVRVRWMSLRTTPFGADQPGTGQDESVHSRFRNTLCLARLALRHPLRGIGLGQFSNYSKNQGKTQKGILGETSCGREEWEGWLGIAAETGLGGPILLLGAFSLVLRRGRHAARESRGSLPFLAPGLVAFAAVAQFCTASYIDLWWWYPLSLAAATGASRGRAGNP